MKYIKRYIEKYYKNYHSSKKNLQNSKYKLIIYS